MVAVPTLNENRYLFSERPMKKERLKVTCINRDHNDKYIFFSHLRTSVNFTSSLSRLPENTNFYNFAAYAALRYIHLDNNNSIGFGLIVCRVSEKIVGVFNVILLPKTIFRDFC